MEAMSKGIGVISIVQAMGTIANSISGDSKVDDKTMYAILPFCKPVSIDMV